MQYTNSKKEPWLTLVGVVRGLKSLRTPELTNKELDKIVDKVSCELDKKQYDIDWCFELKRGEVFKWPSGKLEKEKRKKDKYLIVLPEKTSMMICMKEW